tara:strand:- start:3826 stop:4167 length:342 start_codon:yes stop_codon:yes gene_type:complete
MSDAINKPAHYNSGKFEVIDVIEDWNLGFNLGNTVKYISRAGKKDPTKHLEDLKKARWYLDREINNLDKQLNTSMPVLTVPEPEKLGWNLADSEYFERLQMLASIGDYSRGGY